MRSRKILDQIIGRVHLKLEVLEGDPGIHDYGIPKMAWVRGVKLMKFYGSDKALDLIDERAERAADRGDYETARRWRTLITAIHAVEEEVRLAGDSMH